jgi:hypothetical protein
MKSIYSFLVLTLIIIWTFWGCKQGLGISDEELENLTKPIVDHINPQGLILNDSGFRLAAYGNFQGNDEYALYINNRRIGAERPNYWRYRLWWHVPKNVIRGIIGSGGTGDTSLEIRITSIINYDISEYFDDYSDYISQVKILVIKEKQTNFSTPVRLFEEWSQSYAPILRIDSKDNLYLAWIESLSGIPQAFFCWSQNGGLTWSQVLNISRSSKDVLNIGMDIDEQGYFYMVWQEDYGIDSEVYFSRSLDTGLSWHNPRKLGHDTEGSSNPIIQVDTNGNIHIFWYGWFPYPSSEPDKIRYAISSNQGENWQGRIFDENVDTMGYTATNSGDDGTLYFACDNEYMLRLYTSGDGGLSWQVKNDTLDIGRELGQFTSLVVNKTNEILLIWDTYDYLGHTDNYWIHFLKGMNKGATWSEKQVLNDVCDTAAGQSAIWVKEDHIDVVMNCFASLVLLNSDDLGDNWSFGETIPGTELSVGPTMVKDKQGKIYMVYVHRQDDAAKTRALKLITWQKD